MSFAPSSQQKVIFGAAVSPKYKGNMFVEAVAGAGKTTTLLGICEIVMGSVGLFAYNNKIANELKARLMKSKAADRTSAATFHAIGWSLYRDWAGKVHLTKFKIADIVKNWNLNRDFEKYNQFIFRIVSLAKQRGFGVEQEGFPKIDDQSAWMRLVEHHNLSNLLEKSAKIEVAIELAIKALKESNDCARKIADFDDQIYIPVLHNLQGRKFDWVLVDEAQDTNPVRRALAKLLCKPTSRLIFVGDSRQAIYGFTGADNDSVQIIKKEFACLDLPLTVTYRCPKAVVKAAQAYVSHIQAHESAPEGSVREVWGSDLNWLTEWKDGRLTKEDAILCRKTAPLVDLAYSLIRSGIACRVEGKDIGKGLKNLANKWKKPKSVDDLVHQIEDWAEVEIKRAEEKKQMTRADSIRDQVDTFKVIAEGCQTIQCINDKIDRLFDDSEDAQGNKKPPLLTLSTIHKAKGREWNNVFVWGFADWCPSARAEQNWEIDQENNLIYVAFTRAKANLTLVNGVEKKKEA